MTPRLTLSKQLNSTYSRNTESVGMPEMSLLHGTQSGNSPENQRKFPESPDCTKALQENENELEKVGSSTESPDILKTERISSARRFSVVARNRAFNVINYGSKSIEQSPTSATAPGNTDIISPGLPSVTDARSSCDVVVDIPATDEEYSSDKKEQHQQARRVKSVRLNSEPDVIGYEKDNSSLWDSVELYKQPQSSSGFKNGDLLDFVRRGRIFATRKKDRLVDKNGECKVVYSKVSDRGHRFLVDIFTTILELKWRYHLLIFALTFGLSWLFFALIWWALVTFNEKVKCKKNHDCTPCIDGVTDFSTALLFSIETQHTIGYGTRAITPACPLGIGLLMFQSMYGVMMQCILTGIIFAKMARPKRRAQTIIFSEKAVICQRDGQRSLMFRVGDMRRSQILGVTIKVMLAERRVTKEGENLPIVTQELPVTTESGSDFYFLAWPINIMHHITKDSPLWNLSAVELLEKDCELIVVLEGVDEITGASFQVRTSYLPSEILWGHHLKSLLSKSTGGIYSIDYTFFHDAIPLNISEVSARRASGYHRHGYNVS